MLRMQRDVQICPLRREIAAHYQDVMPFAFFP
jgi:hypothetical protein